MALSITALVPNWNYARYLRPRLDSILTQTLAPDLVIFLDDGSTDDSLAVAREVMEGWPIPVECIASPRNSGSVLGQWVTGLNRVRHDAIWIAEADDAAQPGLLAALAERLDNDPKALFAFADSATMDGDGQIISGDSKAYTTAFDPALLTDQSMEASEFLARCLVPRNSIVNASGVLWRRDALAAAFARLGPAIGRWRCAGDWRLYVEACAGSGRVHYLREPLNLHRLHAASVNGATPRSAHFAEIVALHLCIRRRLGPDKLRDRAMARHLAELSKAWSIGRLAS
jgi:glycosyltransferase involved in cell wall biosynthesis